MAMNDPAELDLVYKAIKSGVTGCYEWDDHEAERLRGDPGLQGLTPEFIRLRLHEHVVEGGAIQQVPKRRPNTTIEPFTTRPLLPSRVSNMGCLSRWN
jgi:hypothetical protein